MSRNFGPWILLPLGVALAMLLISCEEREGREDAEARPSKPRVIASAKAPEAIGPYSQAIAYGDLVFCSGQIPMVPGTKELKNGSIEEATAQVLANLKAVLAEAGCSIEDVLKVNVYLKDLDDFAGMNKVYAETFGTHRPARATVQVARLPADARVEIECIAARRPTP